MSWDFAIMAADEPPVPFEEMPDDWEESPIGTLAETRSKIGICLPNIDWSDPSMGVCVDDLGSYEFKIGKEEPCTNIVVHLRGDERALARLLALAEKWGWYLLDLSRSEWLHHCTSEDLDEDD